MIKNKSMVALTTALAILANPAAVNANKNISEMNRNISETNGYFSEYGDLYVTVTKMIYDNYNPDKVELLAKYDVNGENGVNEDDFYDSLNDLREFLNKDDYEIGRLAVDGNLPVEYCNELMKEFDIKDFVVLNPDNFDFMAIDKDIFAALEKMMICKFDDSHTELVLPDFGDTKAMDITISNFGDGTLSVPSDYANVTSHGEIEYYGPQHNETNIDGFSKRYSDNLSISVYHLQYDYEIADEDVEFCVMYHINGVYSPDDFQKSLDDLRNFVQNSGHKIKRLAFYGDKFSESSCNDIMKALDIKSLFVVNINDFNFNNLSLEELEELILFQEVPFEQEQILLPDIDKMTAIGEFHISNFVGEEMILPPSYEKVCDTYGNCCYGTYPKK